MKDKKPNLEAARMLMKSIRQVIKEKAGGDDRFFSLYCFILEQSDRPHGWTSPITLIDIANAINRRERTVHRIVKDMESLNLIERERIGTVYRYRLVDLKIDYEL